MRAAAKCKFLRIVIVSTVLFLVACDRGPAPSATTLDLPTGSHATSADGCGNVWGTITYSGARVGPSVYVGLFRDQGAGKVSAQPDIARQIKWPDFPVVYSFADVPAGSYFVSAFLSVDSEHPAGPVSASDSVTPPTRIRVAPAAITRQDVQLSDP